MLAMVAAIYLLLALRVRVSLEGSFCDASGNTALSAGTAGFYIRFDGKTRWTQEDGIVKLVPRYAGNPEKKKEKKASGKSLRIVKTYLWFAKAGRMERVAVHMRIGAGDAGKTAIAAGALHAMASAALLRLGRETAVDLRIIPDFDAASLAVYVRCIFSCQPGDIMLAAIRFAMKKRKKKAGERDWVGKASH